MIVGCAANMAIVVPVFVDTHTSDEIEMVFISVQVDCSVIGVNSITAEIGVISVLSVIQLKT
jgi:hypothetical protein